MMIEHLTKSHPQHVAALPPTKKAEEDSRRVTVKTTCIAVHTTHTRRVMRNRECSLRFRVRKTIRSRAAFTSCVISLQFCGGPIRWKIQLVTLWVAEVACILAAVSGPGYCRYGRAKDVHAQRKAAIPADVTNDRPHSCAAVKIDRNGKVNTLLVGFQNVSGDVIVQLNVRSIKQPCSC